MGAHNMPAAEVEVSPGLVRQLLAAQHPDLAHLPVALMANGWDNVMFRLGDGLVVRLPRRELAARLIVNEQRWLPALAPRLPLAVPAPVRAGQPGLGYPWRWSIVPFLPGRTASGDPPRDPREAAVTLGGFLGALHVPAHPDAPANLSRGIPLADRGEVLAGNLDVLRDSVDRDAVLRVWGSAIAAPRWDGAPAWLHGDLHPANIVVNRGRVSGVIDFGDVTAGDPATDLAVAWMLLPAHCHGVFRTVYRTAVTRAAASARPATQAADSALWTRARGWALALSLAFLANSADNGDIAGIGRRSLRAVLG